MPLVRAYAGWLAADGVERGLIGPREHERLWERHLLNCAVVAEVVPAGASVADIGSGAGLPGLVLALARPDLDVTLVEPLLRRSTFLEEVVDDLGLDRVRVVRARADELHGAERFDVVTSRAVAPLERLLRWCMPLVAPSGAMLALKGSSVADEVPDAAGLIREWGLTAPEIVPVGVGVLLSPTQVARVAWSDPASVSWPIAGSSGTSGRPRSTPARKRRPHRGR